MSIASNAYRLKKKEVYVKSLVQKCILFKNIILMSTYEIPASLIHTLRKELRRLDMDNQVVLGRNEYIREALEEASGERAELSLLVPYITGHIGLLFTNGNTDIVCAVVRSLETWVPLKEGKSCPVDVYMPTGPTCLDPAQTSYFPALNIATKISKGKVEILGSGLLLKSGETIGDMHAALFRNLNLKPIPLKFEFIVVLEDYYLRESSTLEYDPKSIINTFIQGVQTIEKIGLAIDYPTPANFLRYFWSAYTNMAAISMETGYVFDHSQKIFMSILGRKLERTKTDLYEQ